MSKGTPAKMPRLKRSERPRPGDDRREHRVLTDKELATVLAACSERTRLHVRFLAENRDTQIGGARADARARRQRKPSRSPNSWPRRRTRAAEATSVQAHDRVTRALAGELRLAARGRVFDLDHDDVDYAWGRALKTARSAAPPPAIHDLRHTHLSGLIADGWDPVEIAARIGDTLETTLRVYAHEFDAGRRGEQRRAALEARYGVADGNSAGRDGKQQTATDRGSEAVNLAAARAARSTAQ
jgi:integrase